MSSTTTTTTTTATMTPIDVTIPQEIFDTIIAQFAHTDDTQSLRTCALVSSSWLATARAHIFHHITLSPPPFLASRFASRTRNYPCERLFNILCTSQPQSVHAPTPGPTAPVNDKAPATAGVVITGKEKRGRGRAFFSKKQQQEHQGQSQKRHFHIGLTGTGVANGAVIGGFKDPKSNSGSGGVHHVHDLGHDDDGRVGGCTNTRRGFPSPSPTGSSCCCHHHRGVSVHSRNQGQDVIFSTTTTTTTNTTKTRSYPDSDSDSDDSILHSNSASPSFQANNLKRNKLGNGIAPYVKSLTLLEGIGPRSWFSHEPTLGPLLRLLTHLEKFEIHCLASGAIFWNHLAPKPREAMRESVLRLGSLERLRLGSLWLDGLDDWIHLVKDCGGLRELEVENVRFKDEGSAFEGVEGSNMPVERRAVKKSPLDVLRLGAGTSPAIVRAFLHSSSRFDMRTVRKLSLTIGADFAEYAKLLRSMTSVERLEITLADDVDLEDYWSLAPYDQLDLSQLPCLQELQVGIDMAKKLSIDQALAWVEHLLKTSGTMVSSEWRSAKGSKLKKLLVVCTTNPLDTSSPSLPPSPTPRPDASDDANNVFSTWEKIDEVLSGEDEEGLGKNLFVKLQQVVVRFLVKHPGNAAQASSAVQSGHASIDETAQVLREAIVHRSRRLSKRGILDVQCLGSSNDPKTAK